MRVRRALPSILAVAIACACAERIKGPDFDVKVTFSEAAGAKLHRLGERIKVAVYFDGDSKRGPSERNAPFRAVLLGQKVLDIGVEEVAHIRGVTFSASDYADLDDGRYFATLNVFSARLRDPNNFLDCGASEITAESLANRTIEVQCRLLGER